MLVMVACRRAGSIPGALATRVRMVPRSCACGYAKFDSRAWRRLVTAATFCHPPDARVTCDTV
jgi:hypothetical protein